MFQKTRHLVEVVKTSIIVFSNHGAFLGIVKQSTLSITSTDKLNLQLVYASDYVQYFPLVINYKSDKHHIIFDALSRLEAVKKDLLKN